MEDLNDKLKILFEYSSNSKERYCNLANYYKIMVKKIIHSSFSLKHL